MAKVTLPKIFAECDKGHFHEEQYLPEAIGKIGGCTCRLDPNGYKIDMCYCTNERRTFEWWCSECQDHYTVELT